MVITATGWTFDQLDATPWPRVKDLLVHWEEYPPPHMTLRVAFLKREEEDEEEEPDDGEKVGFTEAQLRHMCGM